MSINNTLWTEKYRPTEIENYVGADDVKDIISRAIETNDIQHLLLYGKAGGGKTTAAKMIVKNLDCDYIYINASDENNIETIRNKVKTFASTVGFAKIKIIILDEADYLTPNAQATLRNIMETFSANCRFIMTCNYVEKLMEAIQSRCLTVRIHPPSKKDVAMRMSIILKQEGVKFDNKDLAMAVNQHYPDVRAIINMLQAGSNNGEFKIVDSVKMESGYIDKVITILANKAIPAKSKYTDIRTLIAGARVRSFEDLYTALYERGEEYTDSISATTLIIAKYAYQDTFVVDKEINAMALITEIIIENN